MLLGQFVGYYNFFKRADLVRITGPVRLTVRIQNKARKANMRLSSIILDGVPKLVARRAGGWVDLSAADPTLGNSVDSLFEIKDGLERAKAVLESCTATHFIHREEFRYAPLLKRAGKYLCLGLNYSAHAAESPYTVSQYPVVFARFATSIVGNDESLARPKISDEFDYEGELAVVIGKRASRVSEDEALNCVAGYSIFNDGSIRDYQFKTHQWTVGKNVDRTGSFGPDLVTADELPRGAKGLAIKTRLNGAIVQDSNCSNMIFSVSAAISILSQAMTFEQGDVIVMGTPSGVGFARKPPLYMKPGDHVEIEIENIGVLRNSVIQEG
jgi:acylpyruvate hydrolase